MKRGVFIIIFFILATIVFTYPLTFKLTSAIPGSETTDEPFAALWNFWWFNHIFIHHLPADNYSLIAAPFGFALSKPLYPLWEFCNKYLSILTGNVAAYNTEIIFSFILAGTFMYWLAFYLTNNTIAALFSGLVYAFCPYHFARAWQHLGLAQIQWMPLYILGLMKLKDRPGYANLSFAILGIILVISFEAHYAYFMYMATLIFLCTLFLNRKSLPRYLFLGGMTLIVMFAGALFLLPTWALVAFKRIFFNYQAINASAWNIVRPFEDLFPLSSRPLSYLLPAPVHPVLGRITESFIGTSLYGTSLTEHVSYLGWTSIFLSFIAVKNWRRKRSFSSNAPGRAVNDFSFGFFILLAAGSWLLSQPPWWNIFGFKLYMPSFFMYKIAPMFRAYSRFSIVVMLAVSVLAGFGLKSFFEKSNSPIKKILLSFLFLFLAVFEFWNYPPFRIIDVSRFPAAYNWLRDQPDNLIIAEFPLDADTPNEIYKFYQTRHRKNIINGTVPGTGAHRIAKTIRELSSPEVASKLRWMGVKYALVHKDAYLQTDLSKDIEELEKIPQNPGLRYMRSFPAQGCPDKYNICVQKAGQIDVYEVIAQPLNPELKEK